jgi:putative membrane protein
VTEQPLDAATRLAVQRTRLAQERTLMAWIRTSTSSIAFGFTIFKFFEYVATDVRRREPVVSPWIIGMIMILLGLTGLTLAWIQHRQEMKALRAEAGPMPYSIAGMMAGFIHRRSGCDRAGRRGLQDVALHWAQPVAVDYSLNELDS